MPAGYALADGFALRFDGTTLVECVRSRPNAQGFTLAADGPGGLVETEMGGDLLTDRVELALDCGRREALLIPVRGVGVAA